MANKTDLVEYCVEHANVSKKLAQEVIDTVIQIIKEQNANAQSVKCANFGVFKPKATEPRQIKLKSDIFLSKASLKPSFSACSHVKRKLQPQDDDLLML